MIHIRRLYGYVFFTTVNIFGVFNVRLFKRIKKSTALLHKHLDVSQELFCGAFLSKDERSQKTSK